MPLIWNTNIPQPSDLISNSQSQILTNNQSVDAAFNDATNGNFTKYLMQAVGTIASVVDPVSALHAINGTGSTFSGKPIPYFKNSVGDYPMIPDLQVSGNNYSLQIGSIIIKFGKTLAVSNNATQTFVVAFPTNCYMVQTTGGTASGTQPTININPASVSVSSFVYKITNGPADAVFWLAIGD